MPGLKPFDPLGLVLIAALNPIVILVAVMMGRMADQRQKLVVAAFAASIAGFAALWIAIYFRLVPSKGVGGTGGIFVVQCVLGYLWAEVGYWTRGRRSG